MPLGEGSNVVLAGDLHALVVRQAARGIEVLEMSSSHAVLRVAAGENWHELVQWTLHKGYYGLENLALIPGTVGSVTDTEYRRLRCRTSVRAVAGARYSDYRR